MIRLWLVVQDVIGIIFSELIDAHIWTKVISNISALGINAFHTLIGEALPR